MMLSVNALRNKFENLGQQESEPTDTERARVRVNKYKYNKYNMPLRQTTLHFGSGPAMDENTWPTERAQLAKSRSSLQAPTPPVEDVDGDTIIVDTTDIQLRVPLPTPSESATDVSSQSSNTPKVSPRPRSRSKRASNVRKSASRDAMLTLSAPGENTNAERLRNISGDTLVPPASKSQTSLLKDSINVLDMTWNMSVDFVKNLHSGDEAEEGSTITVAIDDADFAEKTQKKEAKRAKALENEKKWDRRRKAAEKSATRKSSRASMLLSKASEVVSTVLGKRIRDAPTIGKEKHQTSSSKRESTMHEEQESDIKRARLGSSSVTMAGDASLAAANRAMRARAPRDKKWLLSGLYAGQRRTLDSTFSEAKNNHKSTTTGAENHSSPLQQTENNTLPLPMFAGARLLESGRDFKLPFDVFSPLPTGQPKPDEWRKVNKNVFVGDAAAEWRTSKFLEHSTCMCKPDTGCDADCMNRYMYYECDERNCNMPGDNCANRAFEGLRHRVKTGGKYNIGVEVIKTGDRGYGVRANRTFEPNQIIVEYTGEIINQEECEDRMHSIYKDNECYYLMAFDQNMIIDATRGSIARFVNHSCSPNCRMEKWTVGGKPRMALFAGDHGIMTGEELTYDYNFDPYSQKNVQVCRCGSENCRGVLGPKPKEHAIKKATPAEEGGKLLAGAKRKLAEVLEESSVLLGGKKRRKTTDLKPLPKGWAYVENAQDSEPKVKRRNTTNDTLSRQPSKLKKGSVTKKQIQRSKSSASKHQNRQSVVGSGSEIGLLTTTTIIGDEVFDDDERPATAPTSAAGAVATLRAKAHTIKRTMSRSIRGKT